jgi:hypothetical protein
VTRQLVETPIMHAVRATLARSGPCWRNNTGVDLARGVRYGLGTGGADLIAVVPVLIVPEHVGRTIGRFAGFEIKSPTGRMTPEQRSWQRAVENAGGSYQLVRDAAVADEALERARSVP